MAEVSPATTLPIVGAPGLPAGVTAADGAEAGEVCTPLVACTMNVYAVPLTIGAPSAKAVATHCSRPAASVTGSQTTGLYAAPREIAETVQPVTGGTATTGLGSQDTVARASPGTAVTAVG